MKAKLVIDQLSISVEDMPGIEPEAFRTALTKELGHMALPQDLADRDIAQLTVPAIEARPGDTAERLASRTADGLAEALRRSGS